MDSAQAALRSPNFAGQYQQAPAPLGRGMVKVGWFKTYTDATVPTQFDLLFQSWDTANKPNELSDYSVCTTWGIKDKHLYLLHVYRKRLDYPDLKPPKAGGPGANRSVPAANHSHRGQGFRNATHSRTGAGGTASS